MKVRTVAVLIGASLLLVVTGATALAQGPNPPPAPQGMTTASAPLTVRTNVGPIAGIDPSFSSWYTPPAMFVVNQLFAGLVRADEVTGEPLPELASGWASSPNASVFTFTLRSGLKWSDGSTLTADDAKRGFLRGLRSDPGGDITFMLDIIQNARGWATGAVTDPDLLGVRVLDSTHLVITCTGPAAYLPSVLTVAPARPVPGAVIDANGVPTWTLPAYIITSGAYRLLAWTDGVSMTLQKSPDYYDAANVQIDRVELAMLSDDAAWTAYQVGQLDTALVPAAAWTAALADPELQPQLHASPRIGTQWASFNTTKAPMDNLLVRQAFAAAIDRQNVVLASGLGGGETPAVTFTPPGSFGHVDGVAEGIGFPYNPVQARSLLAQAGYTNGVGLPAITFLSNADANHAVIEALQQSWFSTLSVSVTVVYTERSQYYSALRDDPPQMWSGRWMYDYPDAYNFLHDPMDWVGSPQQAGHWSNAIYNYLVNVAAQTADLETRKVLYRLAEKILVETDMAMAPVYYMGNGFATRVNLQRDYGRGGWDSRVAAWRISWRAYLPLVLRLVGT